MKVLQFGKFYYPTFGGMERAMYETTEGFNARGIQCDVLCSNTKPDREISQFDGYTAYRAATYGMVNSAPISPDLISRLWKIHKDYDIIHVHHPDPMAFLALYVVRPSAKIVIQWQSDIVRQEMMLKLFLPLQSWVLKRADSIIAASEAYATHSPYLKPYLDKTEIVPIGISDDSFHTDDKKVEQIKEKYAGKKIILAFGRLVTYKGFEYLAEAARYLSDDYVILIGGGGSEEKTISELIGRHQLENSVHLLGHVDESDKYNYYKAASIFCLPSVTKAEAYGIVLLEAMAFGKPIVSSKIEESGMIWVNQDNYTGLQVPPRSPKKLAEAIEVIGNNPELYLKFSNNCIERYESLFTRDKMIDTFDKLYHKLLQDYTISSEQG
ncbi:MAG: glycosyltransferase [Campylobacterota bacterium]|nr:glycosyltransferase [Campylobacterota bacterium]